MEDINRKKIIETFKKVKAGLDADSEGGLLIFNKEGQVIKSTAEIEQFLKILGIKEEEWTQKK